MELEKDPGAVPFNINGEEYDSLFMLVDGFYLLFSRFAGGMKIPITK